MSDHQANQKDQRIFLVQVGLVVFTLALMLIGIAIETQLGEDRSFGFFWYSFLAGCLGTSTRLFVVRSSPNPETRETKSWFSILTPIFFGGLMAGVAYMLFMSGVLSGDGGEGLLRTNLFPSFTSTLPPDELPTLTAYIATRPSTIQDVGKLMIWSFLAGYSEGFVMDAHRKTVKHYEQVRAVHELTFSCYRQMPLLTKDVWRQMLSVSISRATANHEFDLIAFVFMPEHVHLLVLPRTTDSRISGLLKAIKRPYSFRIKQLLKHSNSGLLEKLTIRQRPGVMTFRYWQEGPGYDRNLESPDAIEAAINYIHLNPVRRGLCKKPEEWKWSSARHFLDPVQPADPDLPRIDEASFDLFG